MENHQTDKACIEACLKCAATCDHCASSCLKEEDVKMMARCIQMDLECATVCNAAARLMSLGSKMAPEICALCATMCEACGAECAKHDNDHCRECAAACYACAEECRKMAA